MALAIGALPHGQWTGCHSTPIDAEAPPHGDRKLTDKTNRLSYPFGVLVDTQRPALLRRGRGLPVLHVRQARRHHPQPAARRRLPDLRRQGHEPPRRALQDGQAGDGRLAAGLVEQLPVDRDACARRWRRTTPRSARGRSTRPCSDGLGPRRARAAQVELGAAPRHAAVHGVAGDRRHHLHLRRRAGGRPGPGQSTSWTPIPGLYACGEMVGGLFHGNYPGGTGLMSGAVFGPDRRRQRGGGVSDAPRATCAAQAHRR